MSEKILNCLYIILSIHFTFIVEAGTGELLKSKGYQVFPIQDLSIIKHNQKFITSLDREKNDCDLLVSGTFFDGSLTPVGPFMEDRRISIVNPKTLSRGFVAIMQDGSVILSSMSYTNYDYRNSTHRTEMSKRFFTHLEKLENKTEKTVTHLMGGGAHLIMTNTNNRGYAASVKSIEEKQFFDQGIGNLDSAQMRRTNHIAIITIEEKSYAVITPEVSGRTMQKDFLQAKVKSAIKFDGGSGCSAFLKGSEENICPTKGANPSGFCINF